MSLSTNGQTALIDSIDNLLTIVANDCDDATRKAVLEICDAYRAQPNVAKLIQRAPRPGQRAGVARGNSGR
jgi:hypothetical protein